MHVTTPLSSSSPDAPPWSIHGSVMFWVVQIVLMVLGMDDDAWPLLVAFIAIIVVSVVRLYLRRATARGVLIALAVILVLASVLQGQALSTAVLVPALAGGLLMTTPARRWVLPDPVPDFDREPDKTPDENLDASRANAIDEARDTTSDKPPGETSGEREPAP